MIPYNSPPIGAATSPGLNPLAAALLQGGQLGGGQANPYGPPPGQGGLPPPQTGGAAPGSIPLGSPTNQFGNVPSAPVAGPPTGASQGIGAAQPASIGAPGAASGIGAARPFGFGNIRGLY